MVMGEEFTRRAMEWNFNAWREKLAVEDKEKANKKAQEVSLKTVEEDTTSLTIIQISAAFKAPHDVRKTFFVFAVPFLEYWHG